MTPRKLRSRRPPLLGYERGIRLLIGSALLVALILFGYFNWLLPHQPCGFRSVTGLPCVLCGGTRATTALLHGDLHRAINLNAIAIPAVLLGIAAMTALAWEAASGRRNVPWDGLAELLKKRGYLLLIVLALWWAFQLTRASHIIP